MGGKYSADTMDAKSCKAEETKQRLQTEMETMDNRSWHRDECKRYVGNTRTQIDAFETKKPHDKKVVPGTTRNEHRLLYKHVMHQVLLDQFTLCIHILHIIYKEIIYFFYIYRCTFPMIGYLTKRYSLNRVSIVQRYFFNLLFHLRSANSLRKNEIKLMFFPKSHILFAEEGRPIGPIDWWCAMIEMTMHAMGPP